MASSLLLTNIQAFSLPDGLPGLISHAEQIETVAETVRDAWKPGLSCITITDVIDTLDSGQI